MGKVRGLRARVHQAAVRPKAEAAAPDPEAAFPQASAGGAAGKDWMFAHADIFAKTHVDPSALVQRLELDQKSVASLPRGAEMKVILSKKEKFRLRRERWLQKIAAIKLEEQTRREEQKRRAMAVVGDLKPLWDALPELQELGPRRLPQTRGSSSRNGAPTAFLHHSTCCLHVASSPLLGNTAGLSSLLGSPADPGTSKVSSNPTELSRMSAAQRQQLLEEERARFQKLLASPAYRASPLLAIGQQLAQQMQPEGSGQS
ncbi:ribosome biogenesis protein SLX9 homolog [Ctenodactylus gundi]